jgi:hypothetical protein
MIQIVSVLLGLAGGVAGWFAANFYGRSLILFFELRAQAHEEMLFSADLRPELDRVNFNASAERLRRTASRLKALAGGAPAAVKGVWSFGGYSPGDAADALVGYAYTYDPTTRRVFRSRIEKTLRLRLWTDTRHERSAGSVGEPQAS